MTAKNLDEVENAAFDPMIVETKRDTRGRYWSYIRTGLIVVSDAALTADHPRAVVIPLTPDWSIRIATAERLRCVWRGQTPHALFTLQRRKRIAQALRADDARQASAHLHDIAVAYFGARRVAAEPWKTSALKAQVARLAAYGLTLVDVGYRQLLRGKSAARLRRK